MNAQRAINFVNTHGTPTEKARLRFIWNGTPADDAEVIQLFEGQREDGGFAPPWASDYSSIDATCIRITQAEQLGVSAAHPNLQVALSFLLAKQNSNGSWEEESNVAESAPMWAMPGDKAAQLYLTTNCGFWVAQFKLSGEATDLASSFLKLRINDSGEMPSFLQTHWLAGALWTKLSDRDYATRMIRYFGDRVDKMARSELAWMILAFGLAGLPANHALMYSAAIRLNKMQDPTGPWRGNENNDVHVTLEALRALKMCNRI
jgi:hypothetical protein